MKYNKQPIDIPQQIAILKSRGLKFRDEISALDKLSSISYFRLASYYKHLEQDNISHQFYSKSYFEQVFVDNSELEGFLEKEEVQRRLNRFNGNVSNCLANYCQIMMLFRTSIDKTKPRNY